MLFTLLILKSLTVSMMLLNFTVWTGVSHYTPSYFYVNNPIAQN